MPRVALPLTAPAAGLLLVLLLGPPPPAAVAAHDGVARAVRPAAWWRPVAGAIVGPFTYDARRPFTRGVRRGIDLRTRHGALVRAPCGGRVAFAGAVPGRGRALTVRCGPLVATLLGLRAVATGRGAHVHAGDVVGVAGHDVVRLGARRAGRRFGYVDPAALLGRARLPPIGAAPRPGSPVRRPPRRPPPPVPPRRTVRRAVGPATAPARLAAYGAIGLLAAATGAGALTRRRTRRRRVAAARHRAGRALG